MSKLLKVLTIALTLATPAITYAQWNSPDEKTAYCAATPADLAQKTDLNALVQALSDNTGKVGIDAMTGTWKFSNLFAKAMISFRYDDSGFYVQSEDDVPEKVSICGDSAYAGWFRVAIHEPGCPENRNLYITATAANKFKLRSYASKVLNSVTFKKVSDVPQPNGSPKPGKKL